MIEPINARTLISNGWNIKNRRLLQKRIGKSECEKLYDAYIRVSNAGDAIPSMNGGMEKIFLKSGMPILVSKKDDIKLILKVALEQLKTKFKHPLSFLNENITLENIDRSIKNMECGARKLYNVAYPKTELESETLKTLFSPEYAPKRRTDSNGYAVTTVIDNKTKKPKEVFVKRINKTPRLETWGIYEKEGDEYKEIGFRSFGVNKILGAITPGYMQNRDYSKKYSGIGLRLHQISIERMMQNGYNEIQVESLPESFAFHYKAGFRLIPGLSTYTKGSLATFINSWRQETGLPESVIRNEIISSNVGKLIYLDNKTIENLTVKAFKKNNLIPFAKEKNPAIFNMTMSPEWLDTWKTLAQLQPILL